MRTKKTVTMPDWQAGLMLVGGGALGLVRNSVYAAPGALGLCGGLAWIALMFWLWTLWARGERDAD